MSSPDPYSKYYSEAAKQEEIDKIKNAIHKYTSLPGKYDDDFTIGGSGIRTSWNSMNSNIKGIQK